LNPTKGIERSGRDSGRGVNQLIEPNKGN